MQIYFLLFYKFMSVLDLTLKTDIIFDGINNSNCSTLSIPPHFHAHVCWDLNMEEIPNDKPLILLTGMCLQFVLD
jgi:hypothetical protein